MIIIDSHVHYTIIVIVYKHDVNYLTFAISKCLKSGVKQMGREHWRVFEENKGQFVVTLE